MHFKKDFFSNVIPSVLAFALSGVYAIVDGFFVGNSIGDAGLTAINIAYPAAAFLQAAGTGIGMGGAIQYSINKAKGDHKKEQEYFTGTVLLLILAGIFLTAGGFLFAEPVLRLLGAKGNILSLGLSYLKIIALGASLQILGTGFVPLIRNMGGSFFAMFSMSAGFVTNIVLDYLFVWVFGWGMAGAAAATIIGQGITMLCAVLYFVKKKVKAFKAVSDLKVVTAQIGKTALSPFGITFSPNITLILMNQFCLIYGGESAVACFACISYIMVIVYLLIQGIGDGSQPLLSGSYGAGRHEEMIKIRSYAYRAGMVLSVACMAGIFTGRAYIGQLFGASESVGREVAAVIPVFLAGVLFLCYVRITTSSFYATEKGALSYLLVYIEPLFLLLLLVAMPWFLGEAGVYAAVPVSQILTALVAVGTNRKVKLNLKSTAGHNAGVSMQ